MNSRNSKVLFTLALFLGLTVNAYSQSPQKYFDNGMYEQAFVEAAYKQNKKVKLKEKYTSVIYKSYDIIYADHLKWISSYETNWKATYNRFIRMMKFRAKVKHDGVHDKLKNVLYDSEILDHLAAKFNKDNEKDLAVATRYESEGKYDKAISLYQLIAQRHNEAEPITTLTDRLSIIDHAEKIANCKQIIGDRLVAEGQAVLGGTEESAVAAIDLFELARQYRPLSLEEEEFLALAHLVKGESWIQEAHKLMETPTKQNCRIAYELLEKAKAIRPLTADEEALSKDAKLIGTTRVLVSVDGVKPVHDSETISGFLNKAKASKWLLYLHKNSNDDIIDFEMEITERQPTVVLGKMKREVSQNTRTVEFWEDETDANGNTTQVKKTRKAVAVVATLTRTKTASLSWSVLIKDVEGGNVTDSDSDEAIVEVTNQFASLVSGDALGMPEETETDVDLNSQKFPTDEVMLDQVTALYLSDLKALINGKLLHQRH